jgi:NADPH:quinone reductase-like Zn-dependent oxidoreductase/SAM-dependent methyltransferase
MLQMSFAASSCGGTVKTPTQITKTLPNMWLKNKKMYQGYEDIECLAEENSRGMFDADSTISAVGSSGEIVLQVDQLRHTTSINFDAVEFESPVKRLAYQVAWKEDPDLLSGAQTKELMRASVPPEEAPLDEDEDFQELLAYHYVQNATTSLSSAEVEKMPPHLQKYMAWARHIFKKDHYERLLQSFPRFADEHTREEYEDQQRSRSSAIELHVETGRQLLSILRGESDALNLLFKSGLAGRYYANEMFAANYKMLASYLDLCAHKNPSLKILEVGAGTGGATKPIIAALSNDNKQTGITRFEEYMYTDISPAFFEKAKDLFKGHVDRMSFQVLDIEKDVLSQKFPSDHYDIVICSGVLHISAAMQPILNNIRKLLRPGGKLVQFEPSNPETCRAGFTFGLLKDWWVSKEEHRQFSPLIGEDKWDEDLKAAGFSGIDVAIPSNEVKERQTHSIFISTRVESDNGERHDNGVANDMVIIADPRSTTQKQVAQHLEQSWMDRYASCVTSSFSELSNRKLPANATYIFLVELEESFLRNIQPEEWATLKAIMDQAARVIWATRGGGQRPSNPDMSLVTGFGRSMMTEKLGLDFLELALDGDSSILHAAECVERVVTQRLAGNHEPLEPEYSEEDTRLCIGRLLAADSINERLHGNIVQRKPLEAQLWGEDNKGRCLKVAIQQPGHFESIYFVEDPEVNRVPVAGEVKIRVEAATITPVDVEIAMGHRSGRGFGSECAGTIVQVSPESQFRVGDRVCAGLPQGGLATHVLVSGSAVAKIPENMSFTQAVTLPSAVMIAHYSIMDAARLTEGESLLVSTKSSVTNSAAIALALKTGADVYVTAADETEGAELVKVFSLPSKRVFVKSPSISASIEDGFDAIVSDECAQYASQYCESLAPFGRLINIGPSTSPPLAKDCSYFEVEYADLMSTRKKKKSLQDMMQPLMWLLEMGNPATKFLRFNASQIADAFAYVLNSPGHGKAVFELGLTDLVQVCLRLLIRTVPFG